jgi:hypothetical protein
VVRAPVIGRVDATTPTVRLSEDGRSWAACGAKTWTSEVATAIAACISR